TKVNRPCGAGDEWAPLATHSGCYPLGPRRTAGTPTLPSNGSWERSNRGLFLPRGSSLSGGQQTAVGLPKKRMPWGKPRDTDAADVGTVCYGIEATSTSAAQATR